MGVGVVWVGVQCLGDMYVCLGECMCIVHVCASPILLTALSWCVCTCHQCLWYEYMWESV